MAGQIGNKNALGNRGGKKGFSGRKSAYEEVARALDAHAIFFEEQSQEELEIKIQSGTFSIKDRFLLTAMEGDSSIINKAYQKAVPDNVDITSKGERIFSSLRELSDRELENIASSGEEGTSEEGTGETTV